MIQAATAELVIDLAKENPPDLILTGYAVSFSRSLFNFLSVAKLVVFAGALSVLAFDVEDDGIAVIVEGDAKRVVGLVSPVFHTAVEEVAGVIDDLGDAFFDTDRRLDVGGCEEDDAHFAGRK